MHTNSTTKPRTVAELKASGWKSRSVKQELHDNLLKLLSAHEDIFPGIIGYEDTVIPEVCLAILARHDMLFLGEKGQAKSRMMRGLVRLLDPEIPFIAGSELHDDPLHPISQYGKRLIAAEGDARTLRPNTFGVARL